MKIKDVSERFNIPSSTLRYYEELGLIDQVEKENGIRKYTPHHLEQIEFVLCMKKTGLKLELIRDFVGLYQEGDKTISKRLAILQHYKEKVEEEKKQLKEAEAYLNRKIKIYKEKINSVK